MITGYQDFYYNVRDLPRAVAFYEAAFGMKSIYGNEHWVTLAVGDLRLGLHWTEGAPVPATPRDAHGQHCGGTLTLKSDDIAADKARLEQAGGKILGENNAPWGHMLVFTDPDGNVLKLMRPKY